MKCLLPLLVLYLQFFDLTWANANNPYCIYNKTLMVTTKVNKTREVKLQKPWYKKLSKTSTAVEYYEDEETVPKIITVRSCCKGYIMSTLQLCEPTCSEGCPENSKCVEPEVCKCKPGYYSSLSEHNRKHFCEPICTEPCPEHSVCVGPNECACSAGYRLSENKKCKPHCHSGCPFFGICIEPNYCLCAPGYGEKKGSCWPLCSLGDGCKNGECVDVNECQCNFGYSFNTNDHKCELNLAIFQENTETTSTETNFEYSSDRTTEMYIDSNTFPAYDDFSEPSYESSESAIDGRKREKWSTLKCPDDFVLYRGHCHPLKFALDEIDCRLEPCAVPHSHCTENGTCACLDGYRWFRKPIASDSKEQSHVIVKPVCITLEEYQALINQAQADQTPDEKNDSNENGESSNNKGTPANEDSLNFAPIFFIVLGVLVMTSALVYLGLRLVRPDRGQVDVEGKQLYCAYDNRPRTDAEKTVI